MIHDAGSITGQHYTAGETKVITIPHGLGFIPMCYAYIYYIQGGYTTEAVFFIYGAGAAATFSADKDNMYITISDPLSGALDFDFDVYYYIFNNKVNIAELGLSEKINYIKEA
jgi:hypothetical protein